MSKNTLFLIQTKDGKEFTHMLPVNKYGSMTVSGLEKAHRMMGSPVAKALDLSIYSDFEALSKAIERFSSLKV